jgi:hypothetical protein
MKQDMAKRRMHGLPKEMRRMSIHDVAAAAAVADNAAVADADADAVVAVHTYADPGSHASSPLTR